MNKVNIGVNPRNSGRLTLHSFFIKGLEKHETLTGFYLI
jgi:hypothetical protein